MISKFFITTLQKKILFAINRSFPKANRSDIHTKFFVNTTTDYIVPSPFDKRVVEAVSKAVAEAAIKTGVAQI